MHVLSIFPICVYQALPLEWAFGTAVATATGTAGIDGTELTCVTEMVVAA